MNVNQVIADGAVGATRQPAEESRQLPGVGVVDSRSRVDAMSDLVAVRYHAC
jgi:hypothetical protein